MTLLTKQEVANRLRISVTSLDRMRQRGEIKDVEFGERRPGPGKRIVRFTDEEVERVIRDHMVS